MAPGIVLIILGAVFAFALKADAAWIDTRVLGVILMLGGAAFVWRARVRRRVVVTSDAAGDERTVVEKRVE